MSKNILIVILGPTGSGKSNLAIKLAQLFNGEIISADSRQIYKKMDIGTAKIEGREKIKGKDSYQIKGIPHYLIDLINPDQEFTLAQYKELAIEKIKDIQKRNKIPFLVGGTGLYIQAIVDNLQIPQAKPNQEIRKKLEKLETVELFNQLKKIDPKSAELIAPQNKRRLIRALEVYLTTAKLFSEQRKRGKSLFNVLQIGLKLDREKLKNRIQQRTEKMIKSGLVEEVKKIAQEYSLDLPALSGIGYKEIIQYLEGKINLTEAQQLINIHTLQYSRRQMIWFKRDRRIHWLDLSEQKTLREIKEKAEEIIHNFLNKKIA